MAQTITFTNDEVDQALRDTDWYNARLEEDQAYVAQRTRYGVPAEEEPDRTWLWVALGAAALFFFSPAGRAAEALAQAVKAAVEAIARLIDAVANFITEHPVLSVLLVIAIVALIILL